MKDCKKEFTITVVSRDSRIPVYQKVLICGNEERPAPEDWKNDIGLQTSLFQEGENMLHEMFDFEIEEGDSSKFTVENMHRQSVVDKMMSERNWDEPSDEEIEAIASSKFNKEYEVAKWKAFVEGAKLMRTSISLRNK